MGNTATSPARETYKVIDFRDSDKYMKYKYRTYDNYIHIEPCKNEDIRHMLFLNSDKEPCFMVDEANIIVKGDTPITIDRTTIPCLSTCDGVFDIWLHNCKNVKEITLKINGDVSTLRLDEDACVSDDIQVPLSRNDIGKTRVQRIEFDKYSDKMKNIIHVSFIPAVVFYHNTITLTLNAGAEATLALSTVYLSLEKRQEFSHNHVHFKIHGHEYMYHPLSHKDMFKVHVVKNILHSL